MDELKRERGLEENIQISDIENYGWTAKQVNYEIYWTGWYACGNNIQWTTAENEKKKQMEQEKT